MFNVVTLLSGKKCTKTAVILRRGDSLDEESELEILPVGQDDKSRQNFGVTMSSNRAQVILEFTFCMIIVMFMIYGLMKAFQWTGLDLAERRSAHDNLLIAPIVQSYVNVADGPLKQIDPYFYTPVKMNAIWGGG